MAAVQRFAGLLLAVGPASEAASHGARPFCPSSSFLSKTTPPVVVVVGFASGRDGGTEEQLRV
jgi:hypothetical protein